MLAQLSTAHLVAVIEDQDDTVYAAFTVCESEHLSFCNLHLHQSLQQTLDMESCNAVQDHISIQPQISCSQSPQDRSHACSVQIEAE